MAIAQLVAGLIGAGLGAVTPTKKKEIDIIDEEMLLDETANGVVEDGVYEVEPVQDLMGFPNGSLAAPVSPEMPGMPPSVIDVGPEDYYTPDEYPTTPFPTPTPSDVPVPGTSPEFPLTPPRTIPKSVAKERPRRKMLVPKKTPAVPVKRPPVVVAPKRADIIARYKSISEYERAKQLQKAAKAADPTMKRRIEVAALVKMVRAGKTQKEKLDAFKKLIKLSPGSAKALNPALYAKLTKPTPKNPKPKPKPPVSRPSPRQPPQLFGIKASGSGSFKINGESDFGCANFGKFS